MGKMIKSASSKTFKSSLIFFNKVISIIFGLFCLVTGQTKSFIETTRDSGVVDYGVTPVDTYNFSGNVIDSKSKAVIEGIKVILKTDIEEILIKYGMPILPRQHIVKVDSVYTDENGNFQINTYSEPEMQTPWILQAIDIDSTENGRYNSKEINIGKLSMTEMISGNVGDTVVTIELDPVEVAINGLKSSSIDCNILTTLSGKNIIFELRNWNRKNGLANVIDVKGRIVQEIKVPNSGIFRLNTEDIAKGLYVVNIKIDDINISTQITIQ